jgi:hypothetical protein
MSTPRCLTELAEPGGWMTSYLRCLGAETRATQGSIDDIMRLISARRFRRTSLDEVSWRDTRTKVIAKVAREEPIEFSVPFGCYKNVAAPTAPAPDWAELFNVAYLSEYACNIANSYLPGVTITFSYSTLGVVSANRLAPAAQREYVDRFVSLLAFMNDTVVARRVQFRLLDIAQLYENSEGDAELRQNIADVSSEWRLWPADLRAEKLARAERNLAVSAPSAREVQQSAIGIEAVDRLSRRRWFNKHSDRIEIIFVRGPVPSVHLGTCRTSQCQPLAGIGVLERHYDTWLPRIMSVRRWQDDHARYEMVPVQGVLDWLPELPTERHSVR